MTTNQGKRSPSGAWLQKFGPAPQARITLVGFPFAGSGASIFARWHALAPPWLRVVAIQLPGRENRIHEPPVSRISAMVDPVVRALQPLGSGPLVLYGHSLGALLAYEVARELCASERPPDHLFVAVRRAPHLPRPHAIYHTLDDDAFIDAMGQTYGALPQVIISDPELRALFLPGLRADIEALETYQWRPGPAIPCPTTAIGANSDPHASALQLDAWRQHVAGPFVRQMVDADHFFAKSAPELALDVVVSRLADSTLTV